ncbi:hypothetical protein TthWC1_0432 [Thermoanaerobacter thermohydrosulfuricus WC1]|uniref:DUF4209 domain-containing protein n=1 Tax=Thermoanaerobacter thermohydrosulfuricus WC1 TaxID=1198630 RepID=M8CS79_THETY|nr:DUF4209 domain-containing protein [Thermoanaerobacter thermohydrosulfuricus]EMT40060.1 hypothetical protein TthWC1_0432 [Thermoanaerobacter thermohydrosulfuricus WC1]
MEKSIEFNKIEKFLTDLDTISDKLSEAMIVDKINRFIQKEFEQKPPNTILWEQLAFAFIEDYPKDESNWGTYFGPMATFSNKEGQIIEYPSISEITPEIIHYWEQRTQESKHHILKARYSNLVWDFSEKIIGKKPHYSFAQIYVDSVIEIACKDLHEYEIDTIQKLMRALSLALAINDKDRIEKLKDVIINYEKKIAEDDKPGLWGFSYELLVRDKKISLSDTEENEIITTLEHRFKNLLKRENIWAAQRATELLVDYYKRKGETEKIKNFLLSLGNMIEKKAEKASALVGIAWLEGLYHFYLQHGLKSEADKLSIKIIELGEKGTSEFKKIETSIEISKKELDEFLNTLIEGDIETVLGRIALYYIPKKGDVVKQLKDLSQSAPLSFLFTRKIQDHRGRVIATVGPLEEDLDGNIIRQISQNMSFSAFFLRDTIKILINKFSLNTESIVSYLLASPIFEEERRDFLIKGIKAYLDDDFLVALHILIPQIEASIRNLAEKIGAPILKPSRLGGFHYKNLDDLLTDENIIDVLGEDMCLYLRTLLTDPRGWNLRNNICHGISPIETFNQIAADRVFHVLLCLALVKEEKDR